MNEKELRKQFNEVTRKGLKKIVMSQDFIEIMDLAKQMSNKTLILKLIIFALGFIFVPRLALVYSAYLFIKPLVKLALFIIEVEKEEGISIIK